MFERFVLSNLESQVSSLDNSKSYSPTAGMRSNGRRKRSSSMSATVEELEKLSLNLKDESPDFSCVRPSFLFVE
jgi:hypothetical protein